MGWWIDNRMNKPATDFRFLTQIEEDWNIKPFVDLIMITGKKSDGSGEELICPPEYPEDAVFYDVWLGTTTYCDCTHLPVESEPYVELDRFCNSAGNRK